MIRGQFFKFFYHGCYKLRDIKEANIALVSQTVEPKLLCTWKSKVIHDKESMYMKWKFMTKILNTKHKFRNKIELNVQLFLFVSYLQWWIEIPYNFDFHLPQWNKIHYVWQVIIRSYIFSLFLCENIWSIWSHLILFLSCLDRCSNCMSFSVYSVIFQNIDNTRLWNSGPYLTRIISFLKSSIEFRSFYVEKCFIVLDFQIRMLISNKSC